MEILSQKISANFNKSENLIKCFIYFTSTRLFDASLSKVTKTRRLRYNLNKSISAEDFVGVQVFRLFLFSLIPLSTKICYFFNAYKAEIIIVKCHIQNHTISGVARGEGQPAPGDTISY